MIDTVAHKALPWLDPRGAEARNAIYTSATIARNLADLPFPARCSEEELSTAQDRVLSSLEAEGFLDRGTYFAVADLSPTDLRVLRERDLIQGGFFAHEGACGVYVRDDQMLSIMVNATDHIVIRAHSSGLAPESAVRAVIDTDSVFTGTLDYAFDEKLGYLTASTTTVGTGLTVCAAIHLPGLTMTHQLHDLNASLAEEHHEIRTGPWNGATSLDQATAAGDLIELINTATLGRSEEEIVFHFNHKANDILERERQARERVLSEGRMGIEDRVGRALGVARHARLIEESEGRTLLSSLRLGIEAQLDDAVSLASLNNVFLMSGRGHLELSAGESADAIAISKQRADLFRASFS